MNKEGAEKEPASRVANLKALSTYQRALELESQQRLSEALPVYEKVCEEYLAIYAKGTLSTDDCDRFIDVLKKLGKNELQVLIHIRKKELIEKAEWERWLYLKNKYGDK